MAAVSVVRMSMFSDAGIRNVEPAAPVAGKRVRPGPPPRHLTERLTAPPLAAVYSERMSGMAGRLPPNGSDTTLTGMTRGAFPSRHLAHEGTQSALAVHVPSREGIAPLTCGFYSPPRFAHMDCVRSV